MGFLPGRKDALPGTARVPLHAADPPQEDARGLLAKRSAASPRRRAPAASHLGHLGEVQRGPLLLDLLRSPPLDPDLLVVEDAGLRAAAGEPSGPAPQLRRGGGRAARRRRAVLRGGEAVVRAGEGPLHVHPVSSVPAGGRPPGLASQPAAEGGMLAGERVGPGRQAEARAPLHGGEAVGVALHAPPAVTPPFLDRGPNL